MGGVCILWYRLLFYAIRERYIAVVDRSWRERIVSCKISRHIFNTHNSFFLPLDVEEVHQEVQQCLIKDEQARRLYAGKSKRKGVYCINTENQQVKQLRLKFLDEQNEAKEVSPQADLSLNLFE